MNIIRMKKLTIFQKILAAPLLGLVMYMLYMLYTFHEHSINHNRMRLLQESYLPVLKAVSDNQVLFDNINKTLKDAVLAHEEEWVRQTQANKLQIIRNLQLLKQYPDLTIRENIESIQSSFEAYYQHAVTLSSAMIKDSHLSENQTRMIELLERSRNETSNHFQNLSTSHKQRFRQLVSDTTDSLNSLMIAGGSIGLVLILILAFISYAAITSTRHSLRQVINPMRDMAEGKPSFEKRLIRHTDDEMGELVDSFNLLTDKLEQDYRAIERLSVTDKLTQLYNRAKIEELFASELYQIQRYRIPFSIIMIDLDHFKSVNDTYGHLTGDKVLQELAEILRNNVRKTDHLGRIGGEEFLIIATHSDLEQTLVLAENLREKIARFHFTEAGHKTGSLGVATWHPGDNDTSMIKRADDCLYYAKEHGRNQVVSEAVLDETASLPSLNDG